MEAIQQRDATRALQLAERCVHRYGMHTLESVIERAQGEGHKAQEVRSWLLPLLAQPSVAPAPSLPTPAPQTAPSVALDEAFAPLEVAFPPLTPSQSPPVPPDVPPDPHSLPGRAPDGPSFLSFPAQGQGDGEIPSVDEPFLGGEIVEEREAAPVPTFEVDGPSLSPRSSSRRPLKHDRRAQASPPPISPALEPWLVWMPGVYESRSRS